MPRLKVTLLGHLIVAGGQASGLGVDLATARRLVGNEMVPYIPATALRGAVRIQLEALLRAVPDLAGGEVTTPYTLEEATPGEPPEDLVARLFGCSGSKGERFGGREGCLRFGDALPADPSRARRALALRPGVEIDDHTAAAADKKLFFREVTEASAEPLVFYADLHTGSAAEEDLGYLQAAVETTEAIGAGKSSGGGAVSIAWLSEEPRAGRARVVGEPTTARRARLLCTLLEPLHVGDGGPYANHHATRGHVPGATVRGAVAWALLRSGKARPEEAGFRALFLDEEEPVSFGDALPAGGAEEEPWIAPVTVRRERGGGHQLHDLLVPELARERVNAALAERGLYLRADEGSTRLDPVLARPAGGLLRRTRTRVSIDRHTGTAAPSRLFSIEQIEAWTDTGEPPEPARFVSWVEGLGPEAGETVARLAGLQVLIGAGRNHGMGAVEMAVRLEGEPALAGLEGEGLALADAVEKAAVGYAQRAGLGAAPPLAGVTERAVVAFVALSDYVPEAGATHPLAELGETIGLLRQFVEPGVVGGYDQRPAGGRRAALKDLLPAVGAGSVFVYEIERAAVVPLLARVLPKLRRGVGRRREGGCGRFGLYVPAKEASE